MDRIPAEFIPVKPASRIGGETIEWGDARD
jgi:hypothetical protein